MKRRIKWLGLLAASLVLLFILGREYLVVYEEPVQADVVIALSGDVGRLERAAELYHAGYADAVMLSLANEPGMTVQEATAFGVPESDLILEEEATSTYTNAVYTKEVMMENGFESALVVSSDYHIRRVKLVFDQVYEGTDIELTYVASLRNEVTWYRDRANVWFTVKEFVKLPGYWLGLYRFVDLEI